MQEKGALWNHVSVKDYCYKQHRSHSFHGIPGHPDPDTGFLDNLAHPNQATQWSDTIQVNGKSMTFKLDTGAEVTAISSTAHQNLGLSPLIRFCMDLPDNFCRFTATLTHKDQNLQHQVYVVKGLNTNQLGLPAIT